MSDLLEAMRDLGRRRNIGPQYAVFAEVVEALEAALAKLDTIDRFTAESLTREARGNFEAGYDEACLDIQTILHPEETA